MKRPALPPHWRHAGRRIAHRTARLVPSSLGGRLFAGSAVFTVIALLFTLVVMQHVLTRFVTGQIDQRLDNKIVALASQVRADPDGRIRIEGDADGPPFNGPRHDAFWVVMGPRNALRTAWLRPGDVTLPSADVIGALPAPSGPDGSSPNDHPRTIEAERPGGAAMHIRAARRRVGSTPITIFVAAPVASIAGPMREAMTTVALAMIALALALSLATIAQVRIGLRPLGRLRRQIAAVRSGEASDLPLDQPREVLPLVVELNALLDQNAVTLARARRHVANLAHGLKTPLATMSLGVDRLGGEQAVALRDLLTLVERRIRHHLGRARAAALDGPARTQTPLAERLHDLTDALAKIYATKAVALTLDCPADLAVACEPQDVDEILGNLLENAYKFTRRIVVCRAVAVAATVVVRIEDDGPGLDAEDLERVQQPGQRLDETVPGFGFGLSIARELAELYSGDLVLQSRATGLSVTLTLPRVR